MPLWHKPTLAQIYINELRKKLDTTLVPVFAPDTEVAVGTIGSFDRGEFVAAGTTLSEEFGIDLRTEEDTTPTDWVFASEGAVELVPEGTISVGGVDLLKGKLSFKRDRAVVAAFKGVTQSTAVWPMQLNRRIWELYLSGDIPRGTVIVRTVRRAASGTVVVTRKSGVNVELAADPTLLGGLLSLQGLAAGVTFTGGTQAAFQISGPGMAPFVRVRGMVGDAPGLVDVKQFEADPDSVLGELGSIDVPDVNVDTALGAADWDAPED
jgi:hypothetical protein